MKKIYKDELSLFDNKQAVQCIECATKFKTPIVFTEKELLFIVELVGGDVAKAIDYIKTINK